MKLFLPFSVLLVAFAIPAASQITITQADMPQAKDTIRLSMTTDSAGLPTPALTGAGVTWDYSALISTSQTIDTFLSVSSTPITYQLYFNDPFLYKNYVATVAQAGANLPALGPVTVTNMINYYKDQSANYESVGYGAEVDALPLSVKDDTIDVIYKFPMNYGNADSCHSSSHASVPSIGYYGQKQYRINHVQGWGKLITPYGTFSTLKVKTILYSSDSVYLDTLHIGFKTPKTEQIQYKWLANGQHLPVLEIDETVGSRARQYIYRDSARVKPLGIAETNSPLNNISIYPNPSNGTFTIQFLRNVSTSLNIHNTIEVYNTLGEKVYSQFLIPNSQFLIDLSFQSNGIYFYRVITNSGELIREGKLVIEK
jgi:hypothetical protein